MITLTATRRALVVVVVWLIFFLSREASMIKTDDHRHRSDDNLFTLELHSKFEVKIVWP